MDPGLARDRTALAWTRSALNLLANGTLIARAAFVAHLDVVGVLTAVAAAALALVTWRHGRAIYDHGLVGPDRYHQTGALGLLTVATVVTALVAIVVTLAS